MKKYLAIFLALMLAFSATPAFAGFGTNEDSTYEGEAGQINCSTDLDCSVSANVLTISLETALNPTGSSTFGDADTDSNTFYGQLYMPYFAKTAKPASGLGRGMVVLTTGTDRYDCGHGTTGAATTYTLCFSDGANWRALVE